MIKLYYEYFLMSTTILQYQKMFVKYFIILILQQPGYIVKWFL